MTTEGERVEHDVEQHNMEERAISLGLVGLIVAAVGLVLLRDQGGHSQDVFGWMLASLGVLLVAAGAAVWAAVPLVRPPTTPSTDSGSSDLNPDAMACRARDTGR